jgi:hypothetical protein
MTDDGTPPAAAPDWAAAYTDFLGRRHTYAEICARHGITRQDFDAYRKAHGWKRPSAKSESTRATIRRLKDLLHRRLAELEGQLAAIGKDVSAAESEREIKSMNTLVRTLEKVLELERKHRSPRSRGLRIIDNARREALAQRIEALAESWEDSGTRQTSDN